MPEHHFATPRPVRLEVTLAAGEVHITTVDGDESTVTLEGPEKLLDATKVELDGDRLVIGPRRKPFRSFFGNFEQSLHVRASVPHSSRVEIVTAAGDATLDGTFGGLEMKSASGGVLVTGELTGDARLKTVSGHMRLPRLAGDLTAQTVSGDVTADSVDGSVLFKSVSGGVHVASLREGNVAVQSVSGEVELGIASGTSVDVNAGSAAGKLSSEIPLSDTRGDDGGPTVVIRGNTVSGDIRIVRAA
jgi:DUF4097 and DUF4098 domain-containing protein YvlB